MITLENIIHIINAIATKTAMLTVLFLGITLPIIIFSSLSYIFIELYITAFAKMSWYMYIDSNWNQIGLS